MNHEGHQNGCHDDTLFDESILKSINWDLKTTTFRENISHLNPGNNLVLRALRVSDYEKGYLKLLGQLTNVGDVSRTHFEDQFNQMKNCVGTYYIVVVENTETTEVIASASLIVEKKFIHSAGCRGRIEDVIVDEDNRRLQLGKLLVQVLVLLGRQLSCYKLSLECKEDRAEFYELFGFNKDGQLFMVQRFKH